MFRGCSSLATPPVLPATTIADMCYCQMFWGCTSLQSCPALPATTLVQRCYWNMFRDCVNITESPTLYAVTLPWACYEGMFFGCTSLQKITLYAETVHENASTYQWLSYSSSQENTPVNNTGKIIKKRALTLPTGVSGIPSTWTVEYLD